MKLFEEFMEWICLVIIEIFTSSLALGLIIWAIYLFIAGNPLGIFPLIIGFLFIGLFIGAIKYYLRKK